ncbi:ROK family protein [Actinokineospora soli]|uniref:ROK family protein n=1 Tax=Actinokineospora soli TaxID=1048753 RepID=A0ABW2TSB8_9PSEU
MHVGHRLGVGLLVGGTPFVGRTGAAGEIGRHPVFGWNEAPGLLAAAADRLPTPIRTSGCWPAPRGATGPVAAFDAFAASLASGIAAVSLSVDPSLVVIGGGVTRAGGWILDPIRRHLAELCYDAPALALSTLGDDAVNTGAVEVARDRLRSHLFDRA